VKTLKEIEERQEAIRAELRNIETNPEAEEAQRSQQEQWADTLLEEFDALEEERKPLAERMAKLDKVLYAAKDETKVERTAPDFVSTAKHDPFDNLDAVRTRLMPRGELRGRALDAIERANKFGQLNHDFAENTTNAVQNDQLGGMARHVLLTGSDEYQEAFRAYLENPEENAQRAALSLTLANGGYMLPFVLDPTIVLTNSGSINPWRRISNVKQTTSNTWNGVTSAGVTAAWLAESTEVTDNTPTVGNIAITPAKAAAWVFGSYEVLQDTDFSNELPTLLADAKDRLEEAAFATGTGTGQPKGVITGATTTVTATGVATYAIADVYALQAALPARFRNSPSTAIVASLGIINRTRQFDTAGGASFWTNLGAGQPERVLGVPLYESTTMASALTTGSKIAIYGDFSQFYIVDRVGVSLMYEPMVKGASQRPTGQAGWFMYWRTGSDVATPAAFRVLVTG
jgi:HK97 family phage major capsid protein